MARTRARRRVKEEECEKTCASSRDFERHFADRRVGKKLLVELIKSYDPDAKLSGADKTSLPTARSSSYVRDGG